MKKLTTAIAACFVLTGNVFAANTGPATISELVVNDVGAHVKLATGNGNPDNCANPSIHSLVIPSTRSGYKGILSTLILAYSTNRSVNIYTLGCVGSQNEIDGVVLLP